MSTFLLSKRIIIVAIANGPITDVTVTDGNHDVVTITSLLVLSVRNRTKVHDYLCLERDADILSVRKGT